MHQPAKEVKGSAEGALLVRMVQWARVARRARPRQPCVESDKQHKHSLWGLRLAESDTFSCGAARKGVKRQAVSTGRWSSIGHSKTYIMCGCCTSKVGSARSTKKKKKKRAKKQTKQIQTKDKRKRKRERMRKQKRVVVVNKL